MKHYHIQVYGHVQGVGFRWNSKQQAQRLNLTGWVKNLSDGSVEMEVEGDEGKIQRFIEWCQGGPCSAKVRDVKVQPGDVKQYDEFTIKR